MVICRNKNLIKRAAEVVLNNLAVRGERGSREAGGDGKEETEDSASFIEASTSFILIC